MSRKQNLSLTVLRKGNRVAQLIAEADPDDLQELRRLLLDAVRRDGRYERHIGEYEMQVRLQRNSNLLTTFVTSPDR